MWRGNKVVLAGLALFGLAAILCGSPAVAQLATSGAAAGADNIAPAPVTDIQALPGIEGTSVTVSWSLAADDAGYQAPIGTDFTSGGTFVNVNDVAGYNVWRKAGVDAAEVIITADPGAMEYVDTDVVSGIVYVYSVTAVDAAGNESDPAEAPGVSLGPPPTSSLDKPTFPRIRVILVGSPPTDPDALAQLRSDFARIIAQMLGIDFASVRVTNVKAGSVVIEFEIDDPDAEVLSNTLIATLESDPDAITTTGEDLGVATSFGAVSGQASFDGTDFAFGDVDAAATATQSITVTNDATDPDAVLNIVTQLTGVGYSVAPTGASLAIGQSETLTVTFDATAAGGVNGTYTGELLIKTNDPEAQNTPIALSATIVGGADVQEIELSSPSVSFLQVLVDSTSTRDLVITNTGDIDLVGSATLAGDAAFVADDVTFTIAGGASETISIAFTPTDTVAYSATITITSNDTSEPSLVVPLDGIGVLELTILLPGDFDGDNVVGFTDFFLFADAFGATVGTPNYDVMFDMDGSGDVGFTDFFQFADAFGTTLVDGVIQ